MNSDQPFGTPTSISAAPRSPSSESKNSTAGQTKSGSPLASRMPRVTDAPVRQNTADEFIEFCLDPEAPKTAADYFNKDEPLLSLRIISFQDATIICVLWPHFQWDIVGFGGFMEAWVAVLNGRSPPRMIGFAEDPLDALDTVNVDNPPIAAALDLTGLDKLKFIASVVWEAMAQGKVLQQHFCLPSAMIKHFKGKAMEEIKRRDGLDAYVSEGDVAAALTLKGELPLIYPSSPHAATQLLRLAFQLPDPSTGRSPGAFASNFRSSFHPAPST
jgi:hypothetical protein